MVYEALWYRGRHLYGSSEGEGRGLGRSWRAGSARKLARLTGLLMEAGQASEAQPLLRRMLAATEEEHVRFLNLKPQEHVRFMDLRSTCDV